MRTPSPALGRSATKKKVFSMYPNVCICSVKCWANFEELQLFMKVCKCSSYLLEKFFVYTPVAENVL
jgi:hypothetical protein